MEKKSSRIILEFKVKVKESDALQTEGMNPNLLILEISPNESVSFKLNMKYPSSNRFNPISINFSTNPKD